jgi:beta-lactamase regulating signal transducer with metallopeptidase domain
MNELCEGAGRWLLHASLGGGLLLGVTWVLMRWTRQPARRQLLGDCGMSGALLIAILSLIGPSWLVIGWTRPAEAVAQNDSDNPLADDLPTTIEPSREEAPAVAPEPTPARPLPVEQVPKLALLASTEAPATTPPPAPATLNWPDVVRGGVLLLFGAGALYFLLRLLLGYAALTRLLWQAEAAPPSVRGVWEAMAHGSRWMRLLVCRRLLMPLSCGLLRPTVLLPAQLCDQPAPRQLRWILAHELTHLRRRDAWSALLFGLGQVLFFFLPWFWWLKRQVRLCQEFVADAAAAAQDEQALNYAEFLVSLAHKPAVPVGATGVAGNGSDLFRRVSMLLHDPLRVETRCPRRWSLAVAAILLSLGILGGGLSLRAQAAQEGPIVIILQPSAQTPAEAKVAKKHKIRLYLADEKEQGKDGVLVWRFLDTDAKKTPLTDAEFFVQPQQDVVILELIGGDHNWAYLLKRGDNLEPLHEALHRLEKLCKQGKLTQEAIHREVAKALQQMKARPAKAAEDKMALGRWIEGDGKGDKLLLLTRDHDKLVKVLLKVREQMPDASESEVLKVVLKVLAQHKQSGQEFEIEIVPIQAGGKDKKTPKKVDTIEQIRKLLDELEKIRIEEKALAKHAQELAARAQWAEKLARVHAEFRQAPSAKPRLGVSVEPVTAALADQLNLPKDTGVLVTDVNADSPAAKVGIKVNDVLLKIDGATIPADVGDFVKLIASLKADTPLAVVVLRKGQKQTLGNVQLGSAMPTPKDHTKQDLLHSIEKVEDPDITFKLKHQLKDTPPETDKNAMTVSVTRAGNHYTVRYQEGTLKITLTASIQDHLGTLKSIAIQQGNSVVMYASPSQVPEQFRARVQQMIEMLVAAVTQEKQP